MLFQRYTTSEAGQATDGDLAEVFANAEPLGGNEQLDFVDIWPEETLPPIP